MSMENKHLDFKISLVIEAPASKVWEAITTPSIIKSYLFGTDVLTDWKEGSDIVYTGIWNGKTYQDKGKIVEYDPGKRLVTTYWSSMAGLPDNEDFYQTVSYELEPIRKGTRLTLTQNNIADEDSVKHSKQNWQMVLEKLKEVVERS